MENIFAEIVKILLVRNHALSLLPFLRGFGAA